MRELWNSIRIKGWSTIGENRGGSGRADLQREIRSNHARHQRVNPTAIDVAEQIASFRDVLASGIGGGERLAVHIPAATWPVTVDVNESEVPLVNLIVNAGDAMPDGGTVTRKPCAPFSRRHSDVERVRGAHRRGYRSWHPR